MIERLEPKEWLEYNAMLQKKKNALRSELTQKGILQKGAVNTFDKYKYFSEAQYKELFTGLFSKYQLELKFDEISYDTFEGTEKQANGRMPKVMFYLFDCETGFYETTTITGEGIDKGDKAGYKAYTGALKYYLADTFMVATGDDPEKESPEATMNNKKQQPKQQIQRSPMTEEQSTIINGLEDKLKSWLLKKFNIASLDKLSSEQASWFIAEMNKKKEGKQ